MDNVRTDSASKHNTSARLKASLEDKQNEHQLFQNNINTNKQHYQYNTGKNSSASGFFATSQLIANQQQVAATAAAKKLQFKTNSKSINKSIATKTNKLSTLVKRTLSSLQETTNSFKNHQNFLSFDLSNSNGDCKFEGSNSGSTNFISNYSSSSGSSSYNNNSNRTSGNGKSYTSNITERINQFASAAVEAARSKTTPTKSRLDHSAREGKLLSRVQKHSQQALPNNKASLYTRNLVDSSTTSAIIKSRSISTSKCNSNNSGKDSIRNTVGPLSQSIDKDCSNSKPNIITKNTSYYSSEKSKSSNNSGSISNSSSNSRGSSTSKVIGDNFYLFDSNNNINYNKSSVVLTKGSSKLPATITSNNKENIETNAMFNVNPLNSILSNINNINGENESKLDQYPKRAYETNNKTTADILAISKQRGSILHNNSSNSNMIGRNVETYVTRSKASSSEITSDSNSPHNCSERSRSNTTTTTATTNSTNNARVVATSSLTSSSGGGTTTSSASSSGSAGSNGLNTTCGVDNNIVAKHHQQHVSSVTNLVPKASLRSKSLALQHQASFSNMNELDSVNNSYNSFSKDSENITCHQHLNHNLSHQRADLLKAAADLKLSLIDSENDSQINYNQKQAINKSANNNNQHESGIFHKQPQFKKQDTSETAQIHLHSLKNDTHQHSKQRHQFEQQNTSPCKVTPISNNSRNCIVSNQAAVDSCDQNQDTSGQMVSADCSADCIDSVVVSPRQVLQVYKSRLSKHELSEILTYPEIYFIGANSCKDRIMNGVVVTRNDGFDDAQGSYIHVAHDHIAYRYEMLKMIGKGSFGSVVRAFDHKTMQHVALKMVRNEKRFHQQAQEEIKILQYLRERDVNNTMNVIHMFEHFIFRDHTCITFELLSLNLYELTRKNKFMGFSTHLVRRFAYSILKCLEALNEHRIIHCDLKPENVLLKQQSRSGIKVIDFGSSCFENKRIHSYIQSRFYRSPETILGAEYGMPIDMWSFGCILAELVTGQPLLPGENEGDQLACIVELLGMPPQSLILKSKPCRVKLFFNSLGYPRYCATEQLPNGKVIFLGGRSQRGKNRLPPAARSWSEALGANSSDINFVNFVRRCLEWDPKDRMTPAIALKHPWLVRRKLPMPPKTTTISSTNAATTVTSTPSTNTSSQQRAAIGCA